MRQIEVPAGSYSFDPTAKTVTVTGTTFTTEQVLLVENVTRGADLYRPLDPARALSTPVSSGVITLNASVDTSAHLAGDKLRIVLAQEDAQPVSDADGLAKLEAIRALSASIEGKTATAAKQDTAITSIQAILTELSGKLEAGQEVALTSATLAALESITATVANMPSDFPDAATLAKLEAVRVLLAGTLAVSASSLPLPAGAATSAKQDTIITALSALQTELNAKLEAGQAVGLDAATLAALENINATIQNWPSDYPDAATLAKLEAMRAILAGTLDVNVVSGGGSNASVGANGAAVPASSTAIGARDASGNLHQVSEGRAAAASSLPVALSVEDLAAILAGVDAEMGKTYVGNMREKFRETFNTKDAENWDFSENANDKVFIDGNAASESYAVFSKSALVNGTTSSWMSKKSFKLPYKTIFGMSLAQRVGGEEFAVEMVGVDGSGNVIENAAPASVAISGTITIASNVGTVNTTLPHGIEQGSVVVLSGNTDSRMNVGPVVATVITKNQITVPITAANATYTAGGSITYKNPTGFATNCFGTRWQGVTAGNADVMSANGGTTRVVAWNPGNTQDVALIPNENGIDYTSKNFTRAFRSKGSWHMEHQTDQLLWAAYDSDATGTLRSQSARDNAIPTGMDFKIRLRATSFANKSIPVGKILSITKSGSTTATVTMDRPHGLTVTSSQIQIFAVRDQTNFVNVTVAAPIASVLNATQFTIAFGASATASSYGGYVVLVQGNSAPAQSAVVAQTYAKTADGLRMSTVGNATWAGVLTIGATVTAYGFVNASNAAIAGIEGRWRVASIATTTLELEPLDGQDVSALPASATNCGGGFIANSDLRMNRLAVLDRFAMKVESSTAANVASRAMPVYLNGGSLALSGTSAMNLSQINGASMAVLSTSGGNALAFMLGAPVSAADVASAARTSSGNSGAIVGAFGASFSALLSVTAQSGTSPTLDVRLEESIDNGTTWYKVWDFPRFAATTGTARMPALPLGGRRRFAWDIAGTTPSFTFSITVMQGNQAALVQRQAFDRTANVLNGTANNQTAAIDASGLNSFGFKVTISAATTPASYQVQLSDDGVNWANSGTPVAALAGQTVQVLPAQFATAGFARLNVSSGATGQTGTLVSFYGTN